MADGEIERAQAAILAAAAPLIGVRDGALIDLPGEADPDDCATWLGETALMQRLGARRVPQAAPDAAWMIGPVTRPGPASVDVVWIGADATGAGLAEATGLQTVGANIEFSDFADGVDVSVAAQSAGERLLATDWPRLSVRPASAETYRGLPATARARLWVQRALRLLSLGRVVITDRPRVHILCTLAGIPHVLMAGGGDIEGDLWQLAATPQQAWAAAQSRLARQLAVPPIDLAALFPTSDPLEIWRHRRERAARRLSPGARVLDLGQGEGAMEALVPEAAAYRRADFDGAQADGADHICALGVLERLDDPAALWTWLATARVRVILTYPVLTPACAPDHRRRLGWRSDLTRAELLTMAKEAGFMLTAEEAAPPDSLLLVFDPAPASQAAPAAPPPARRRSRTRSDRSPRARSGRG